MLVYSLTVAQSIIRSYLFILLFSLSYSQYFICPQRPIFDLLKWKEINSNQILIPKVGPIINSALDSSYITSFYYSNKKLNGILTGEIFPEVSVNSTDGTRFRLYGSAAIAMNDKLMIQNEFEFDNKGKNDLHFQGVERGLYNGWVGYLQHSSLTYNYIQGHVSIGRGNPYFFNVNESLLINPNFPMAEYLWWQHEMKWLQYDWGFLMLDDKEALNRFITFHRYGIKKKNWRIGFTEAVMGTYDQLSSEEMGYVMPAAVHLETEENRGINANLIWLVDGMLKWNRWTFYGELLIDDFALDGKSPPQIAGSIGLGRKFDNNTLINVEYTRINRWTGNYCDSLKRWIEMNVPIGHSIGSDAHQFMFNSYYHINDKMAVDFSYIWVENGNGTPLERLYDWPNDLKCEVNFGYNSEPFPSNSNIESSGKAKLYYLFRDWVIIETQVLLYKKMSPYFMATLCMHLN